MEVDERDRPTAADAKARAKVRFRIGKHVREGTLTYWPGRRSTRPPTVMAGGSRYHPAPEDVEVIRDIQ